MHIYFEFYVKVEKMFERKTQNISQHFQQKKIQISFITTIQFIKLFFFLKYLLLIMYTLQEIKLCPQTFSKMTVINKMIE